MSDICKSLPQDVDLFRDLSRCQDVGHLHRISDIIHRLINFEESRRTGRCVVNHGVDDDLDQRIIIVIIWGCWDMIQSNETLVLSSETSVQQHAPDL